VDGTSVAGLTPPMIRDVTPADHAAILDINNATYPAMNLLDAPALAGIIAECTYARVAVDEQGVAAFLLGLPPGADYDSDNYRWFSARYDDFVYVDRIAVHPRAQNHGLGAALYDDMAQWGTGRCPCILAEVNLIPPNPGSQRFHLRYGFTAVGELDHPFDGTYTKRTVMLHRALSTLT
jgi:predicted GNAT superfamily acetyltransferase